MRLVTFLPVEGAPRAGLSDGETVVDLAAAAAHLAISGRLDSVLGILDENRLDDVRALQERLRGQEGPWRLPAGSVRLLAAIPRPPKVWGVATNYRDFCARAGMALPRSPKVFLKSPLTVVGPGEAIVIPPVARWVTYEGELGVVIGQACRGVPAAEALDYVAGYVVLNDVTANDLLEEDGQPTRGKNIDTFCPLGPFLVTKEEVPDPHDLPVRVTVNGEVRQDSNTRQLVFGVPALIEYLSAFATLEPGDIVATGTPAGTAKQHEPPAYLADGDVVEIEVGALGRLANRVQQCSWRYPAPGRIQAGRLA